MSSWGAAHAAVRCAKIFSCCDPGEQTTFNYADEAQCRQMVAATEQKALNEDVAQGVIVYDPKAARRCLDELTAGTCAALSTSTEDAVAPSCASVVRGALPLGAACEDLDAICQSGNCTGTCAPPRGCPVSCDAGQFCDGSTHACGPVLPDGSACTENVQCTAPSVCRTRVCGPPLADGTACTNDADCMSGACVVTTLGSAACGARLPNGATCFRDPDCASGACLGSSPAPLACRAPMPDGAPCASAAQCSSGTCVSRAAGAMATCGPPLCDGV